MSPVAAVIIIVSASVKVNPLVLVKRFGAFVLQIHVRSQRCRQETVCTKLVKV